MRQVPLAPVVACLWLILLAPACGALELRQFASPQQERQFHALIAELRCLVCQNQSLADSDADLAKDLRREVHTMINDGKSNEDIVEFMVARYGDFVLYRPPLKLSTLMLWVGPFALGLIALIALIRQIRHRRAVAPEPSQLTDDERARLDALIDRHH